MKHKDLARRLEKFGWWLVSNKGPHEKLTNGEDTKAVPRHKEINEYTAKAILKFAELNQGRGSEK